MRIDDEVVAVLSDFDRALPFVRQHYEQIFEEDPGLSPFVQETTGETKARYYRAAGDFVEFKDADRTVGLLVGTPTDWSTYYIRSVAVLPGYQGKKVPQVVLRMVCRVLAAGGVERIEAHTSPANLAVIQVLTRMKFNITGSVLSERWGSLVQMTKFLNEEMERAFLRQFCGGIKYQLRSRGESVEVASGKREGGER